MTLIRRVLCFLFGHRWQSVFRFPEGWFARECTRCGKRQRKLGTVWLPAGEDWGWVE